MDGTVYPVNPRLCVEPWTDAMLMFWNYQRGGGFGVGYLPEGGGTAQQAVLMLDAFAVMTAAYDEFKPKGGSS